MLNDRKIQRQCISLIRTQEQQSLEAMAKAEQSARVLAWCFLGAVVLLIGGCVKTASAQEFEVIKAIVTSKVAGTGATVSEFVVPKFSAEDVEKIKKARRELEAA